MPNRGLRTIVSHYSFLEEILGRWEDAGLGSTRAFDFGRDMDPHGRVGAPCALEVSDITLVAEPSCLNVGTFEGS